VQCCRRWRQSFRARLGFALAGSTRPREQRKAAHGSGEKAAVLPLIALFDGIAKNPAAPEY
jgi:hypothetical protein